MLYDHIKLYESYSGQSIRARNGILPEQDNLICAFLVLFVLVLKLIISEGKTLQLHKNYN